MNRQAQSFLLALLGAFVIRLGVTDEHLLYVRGWTRWPMIAAGAVLLVLAAGMVIAHVRGAQEGEPAPRTSWLLFAPIVVIMLVSPPALGSYYAERAVDTEFRASDVEPSALRPLPAGDTVALPVSAFFVRARYDAGTSLRDREVVLTGFVSKDQDGGWYVTRFQIACCAADAIAVRVRVDGAPETPDRDTWVRVTGTWIEGSGVSRRDGAPAIEATDVETIPMPHNPYE